jgi:hypothetical protein
MSQELMRGVSLWQERHLADFCSASASFLLKMKIPAPPDPIFSRWAAPGPWQLSQSYLLAGESGIAFFEWMDPA